MGCTAGWLNISLDDEKHIELFAETFIEVMGEDLYDPLEKEDIIDCFDTSGDIMFTLDAEPIFSFGHGYELVIEFLKTFIKKAPDVELDGDFYSDWDNCCDICFLKFEYKDNKLSIMRLFAEIFGVECEGCGEEVEMSDAEVCFGDDCHLECPECGAKLSLEDDEDCCSVFFDDITLVDGEWVLPEGFEDCSEGDEYLTGIAPDEVTNAWKYEDELAEKGVRPDLPKGSASWDDLPRLHAAAEEGDRKAIETLAALTALDAEFSAELTDMAKSAEDEADCDCCEDECDDDKTEVIADEIEQEEVAEEELATDADEPAPEQKKKSKWWVILLIIAILAAGAAAVQLLGLYDFIGLINNLI